MFPILFDFGFFALPSYGALVAAGYLAGILWLRARAPEMGLDEDGFWFLIYCLFFGAIAGGKLLYMAVELPRFISGELRLIGDFRYGFVFFGGFLGALAMGVVARRRLKFDYLKTADFFGVALPMGHAIGRLGCLAAGCCYGGPSTLPWALAFPEHAASSLPERLWGVPLHPVQLYESGLNALIAIFLAGFVLPRVRRGALREGSVFLGYVVLYSAVRFALEFVRGDDRGGPFGPFHVSQWISLLSIAAAGALLSRRGVKHVQ